MGFYLDTSCMDRVIESVQNLAKETEQATENFQKQLTAATYGWYGQGRTMFDKKANMLIKVMGDVTDSLYEIGEDLLNAAESYMEADMTLAQSMDGVQSYSSVEAQAARSQVDSMMGG